MLKNLIGYVKDGHHSHFPNWSNAWWMIRHINYPRSLPSELLVHSHAPHSAQTNRGTPETVRGSQISDHLSYPGELQVAKALFITAREVPPWHCLRWGRMRHGSGRALGAGGGALTACGERRYYYTPTLTAASARAPGRAYLQKPPPVGEAAKSESPHPRAAHARRAGGSGPWVSGGRRALPGLDAHPGAAAPPTAGCRPRSGGGCRAAGPGLSDAHRRPFGGRWRAAGSGRAPPEVAAMMPALSAPRRGCRSLYRLYVRCQAAPLRRACHGECSASPSVWERGVTPRWGWGSKKSEVRCRWGRAGAAAGSGCFKGKCSRGGCCVSWDVMWRAGVSQRSVGLRRCHLQPSRKNSAWFVYRHSINWSVVWQDGISNVNQGQAFPLGRRFCKVKVLTGFLIAT